MNSFIMCPSCASKKLWKSGKNNNKQDSIQRYQCKSCKKVFTLRQNKNKTYPINTILNSVSYYNLGYSQEEINKIINKKYKLKPSQKTISNWINEYKNITSFNKLRKQAIKLYHPNEIIETHTFLHNNLPYKFQVNKAKLNILFKSKLYNNKYTSTTKFKEPLTKYLNKVTTKDFPHHIFTYHKKEDKNSNNQNKEISNQNNIKNQEQRASQIKFTNPNITKLLKNNLANKLTSLAINLAKNNHQRHNAVHNFFLINDSTTIATEIPVYLTKDDITYFTSKGFNIKDLLTQKTPITGHIDLIQIRNNLIHILDYKPDAKKQNPINQLTLYALALASRTKLDLKSFKCAWFDEHNYFEFFPLHVVYSKRM